MKARLQKEGRRLDDYIYIERERERDKNKKSANRNEQVVVPLYYIPYILFTL